MRDLQSLMRRTTLYGTVTNLRSTTSPFCMPFYLPFAAFVLTNYSFANANSLANSNPTVLQGNFALIGIQENFDCSEGLAANQVNFTASDGYTILLANPLNQTQVYATSDVFEIKAQGATYPASSATPTDGSSTAASGSSTGSASGSSNTSGSSSSGALPNVQAGGLVGLVMAGAAALLAL